MPWSTADFPASMGNLPPAVFAKAIEIANTLLAEGMDEGKAIRIAITKAKQWAAGSRGAVDASDRKTGPAAGTAADSDRLTQVSTRRAATRTL